MDVDLTPNDASPASSILSGNPDTMGPLPPAVTDSGQPTDRTNAATPATDPLASIQPGTQQPQTTPASQDPEMVAGAAHQTELAKIMHAVGGLLGGDKTYKATPQKDGSIKVEASDSSTGEMWRRVAAMALTGAAKGMEAGQGPGGAARATSAGIESGLAFKQSQLDAANKNAETQQNIQMKNAQNALLNVRLTAASKDLSHMDRDDQQAQIDRAFKHESELHEMGFEPLLKNATTKEIAQYGIANPLAVGQHMGANGDMIYNEPDGKGGTNIYSLSAESANAPITKPKSLEFWQPDPDDQTKVIRKIITIPAGTKNGDLATKMMAVNLNNLNVSKAANQAKTDQGKTADASIPKNFATAQAMANLEPDPTKKAAYQKTADQIRQQENQKAAAGRAPRQTLEGGLNPDGSDGMTWREIVDGMKAGKVDITKLVGIRNNSTLRAQLTAQAMKEDPTYSMTNFPARQKMYNDLSTGTLGDQVQSFNQFAGHAKEFSEQVANLRNTNSPLINTPLNKLRTAANSNPAAARVLPLLVTARDEFENFIHNNKALKESEVREGEDILNKNMGMAAFEQATKGMFSTGLTRLGTSNDRYKRIMGGADIPELLNDESQQAIDNLGFRDRANTVLGTAAQRKGAGAPTPTPQGGASAPTFDAGIWSRVKNVQDPQQIQRAVDQARSKGMTISNLPAGVK